MDQQSKSNIWYLQAQLDIQGLVDALQADRAELRKRAAAALRSMGAANAVPALRQALTVEDDEDARASIVIALRTLADDFEDDQDGEDFSPSAQQTLVNRLIEQLQSTNPERVITAAHQLGDLGDKLAVEPLVVIFKDARVSIQVRLAVAEALLKLDSAPVEVSLLAALRHNQWNIRRNGAAILGQLRADWAVEPLARALDDDNAMVRRTARAALKHIDTPEARRCLARYRGQKGRVPHTEREPRNPSATDNEHDPSTEPTLPIAPRDGLLKRIAEKRAHEKSEKDDVPQDEAPDDDWPSALNRSSMGPTRPLRPYWGRPYSSDPDAKTPHDPSDSRPASDAHDHDDDADT